MTATQSIESQDITIGDVFQAFYAVPDYQREYVWQGAQVEQLPGDAVGEMPLRPQDGPPAEYFIGSIVVCSNSAGVLDLIISRSTGRGVGWGRGSPPAGGSHFDCESTIVRQARASAEQHRESDA